ncbi:MAG: hypothetical protein M5R42_06715 [Rhodocyclaceae bacterium]|nr:hypothetical protein [Rhodocyclaceae bacterium]
MTPLLIGLLIIVFTVLVLATGLPIAFRPGRSRAGLHDLLRRLARRPFRAGDDLRRAR